MTKRMTLLARKEGLSTSDFRSYWAGPHARLALGMSGITKYVHNRVDKILWASEGTAAFDVDGIVELSFADAEAMRIAQASAVGQKFILEDEPLFLKGWTLCVVETDGEESDEPVVKVVVPFYAPVEARNGLGHDLARVASRLRAFSRSRNVPVSQETQLHPDPRSKQNRPRAVGIGAARECEQTAPQRW